MELTDGIPGRSPDADRTIRPLDRWLGATTAPDGSSCTEMGNRTSTCGRPSATASRGGRDSAREPLGWYRGSRGFARTMICLRGLDLDGELGTVLEEVEGKAGVVVVLVLALLRERNRGRVSMKGPQLGPEGDL